MEERPDEVQSLRRKDRKSIDSSGTKVLVLFLILLVAGTAGYFMYRSLLVGHILAHVGALGVLGLLGVAAEYIARKKGFKHWWAFSLGFALPALLGLLAVFTLYFLRGPGTPIYCGGSVSLAVALIILLGYSLMRRKPQH